jgi:histidyl-tRNA synthetase
MFRHERPQSGRFRQFHQVDVEAVGSAGPGVDAEVIALADHLLRAWGLGEVELHVNSIGDPACRPAYREAFVAYLTGRRDDLCADCRVRLEKNPLRILDCKQAGCHAVAAGAPTISGFLCEPCREHFTAVRSLLGGLGVRHHVNERLVRGLDYYTRTTFEFLNAALGAQNAVAGGGRYDGLVEEVGGPPTPSIGFAVGLERILASLGAMARGPEPAADGVYVAMAGIGLGPALTLAQALRRHGIRTGVDLDGRSLKAQLRQANKEQFGFAAILGEAELARGRVTLKDLTSGEQREVDRADLVPAVTASPEKERPR